MRRIIRHTKNIIFIASGILLFLLGIFGLVLPILPGIILMIIGLLVIARGSEKFSNSKIYKKIFCFLEENLPDRFSTLL